MSSAIVSWVVVGQRVRRPSCGGEGLLAWLLDLVRRADPELSAALHEERRHKPFAVSPVVDSHSGAAWLRVSSLDPALSALLQALPREAVAAPTEGRLGLRVATCGVARGVHDLAGESSFATLMTAWDRPTHKATLRFDSPTAFEGALARSLFPTPELAFGSLARRWNARAPAPLPEPVIDELLAHLRVERYQLATSRWPIRGVEQPGFTGVCTFGLPRDAGGEAGRALSLLAAFAPWCGVGSRTTMGMGQTRYEPD